MDSSDPSSMEWFRMRVRCLETALEAVWVSDGQFIFIVAIWIRELPKCIPAEVFFYRSQRDPVEGTFSENHRGGRHRQKDLPVSNFKFSRCVVSGGNRRRERLIMETVREGVNDFQSRQS